MSLEELNDQIYKREGETKPEPSFSFPEPSVPPTPGVVPTPKRWADHPPAFQKLSLKEHLLRRKKLMLGLGLGLFVLVSLLIFFGRRTFLFNPDTVEVKLSGPKVTETGNPVTFTIQYTNPNWVGLGESELVITYPETFHLLDTQDWKVARRQAIRTLPALPRRSKGEITFTGNFQSFDQTTALLSASLRYGPDGIASRTEKRSEWGVELERSLIGIEVNGPPTVVSGQSVEYIVEYHNDGEETLETGEVVLEYPEGFTPTSFTPQPRREDKVWGIGMLKGGTSGSISIKGVVIGRTGDSKRITARIGKEEGDGTFVTLAEEDKTTQVMAPPLSLSLSADEGKSVVKSGEGIGFHLTFRNEGSFGLRDLVATVNLDPSKFDVGNLLVPKGVKYSIETHQATFKAADVPSLRSLEPGQGGEITFSVPVRSDLALRGMHDVELVVAAMMDSPDMPHSTNTESLIARGEVHFKVQTDTTVVVNGYFHDDAYPNSGPLPPKVGQETTYTLHISVGSSLNTINDGKLILSFPSVVRYLGTLPGEQAGVNFNERTGELSWKLSPVSAGTNNSKTLVLRIGVTPPPNSVGEELSIMNNGEFTAHDAFTNTEIRVPLLGKTTNLREDSRLLSNEGRVVAE